MSSEDEFRDDRAGSSSLEILVQSVTTSFCQFVIPFVDWNHTICWFVTEQSSGGRADAAGIFKPNSTRAADHLAANPC